MKLELKNRIYKAIDKVINDSCEENLWTHYIHDRLVEQMTDAATSVFDSAEYAQEFYRKEHF